MGAKELNSVQQELFEAVRLGDAQRVQNWLLSKRNKRPRTPLSFLRASTASNLVCLSTIVDPSNGYTVLHLAALLGHKEVVRILLNVDGQLARIKDRRGCLPVHLAAWNGHVEALQILIDAEPKTVDAVNNAKESPLHLSAQHGHGKVVTALLSKHADAKLRNARAETALDVAARLGKANVCRLIICSCPELVLQSASECMTTDSGRSRHLAQVVYPLHAAARHGHLDCLDILCHSGFDLDYVTEEGSALHVAALFGKVEAVKLLLERGISVDSRDGQGRTVLETLAEHESEKASDLTQVIQSREGWSECRKLIEGCIQKQKNLHSEETQPENSAIYVNLSHCSKYVSDPKDVVWKLIPEASTARLQAFRTRLQYASTAAGVASDVNLYCPPTFMAEMITLPGNKCDSDGIATLSLSTSLVEPLEGDFGSQIGGSSVENGTAQFSVITPSHKYRHGLGRNGNPLPRMGIGCASVSSDSATACSYQAPLSYDAWHSSQVGPYDNVISPPHPHLAYDNVPRNLLVYDNAPPPGHRRWQHVCEAKGSGNYNGCENDGRSFDTSSSGCLGDSAHIVPPVKPSRQYIHLRAKTCNPEGCYQQTRLHEIVDSSADSSGVVVNDKDIPPSTFSHRTESRASVVTFSCSTLERSITPEEQHNNVLLETTTLIRGRAPLALPEEVSVSASASILSVQNSPERCLLDDDQYVRRSPLLNDEKTSSDRNSTATTVLHLTPPLRDDVKHYISQFPSKELHFTQKDPLSPSSTVGSECTLASSCSLPVISHFSSASPSIISPSQECTYFYKQSSMDDQSLSSVDMRLRTASSVPVRYNLGKALRRLSVSSDIEQLKGELDNSPQGSFVQSGKVLTRSSLHESVEWRKIGEIMESFGGAICRESVFDSQYEPKVAVYLRDRRSQALMLQLNGPQTSQNKQSYEYDTDKRLKQLRGINAVAEWLNVSVGIPCPRANEIAEILDNNGFDSVDYMQSTLDRAAMQGIGLDKSTQHQIGIYLENYPSVCTPSANSFMYVSDWLHSLGLEDYLGHFITGGLTSMLIVFAIDSTKKHLKTLGITKLGHQKRILNSLKEAKEERRQRAAERAAVATAQEEVDSGQESRNTVQSSTSTQNSHSVVVKEHYTEWHHSSHTLIKDCVSFSAHYLGSMEISNVEGTEDSRRAMIKLKRGIREIAKVPHVVLEISVWGVRVLDPVTKQLTVEHEITQIQIVCQDERDLNCFAYISQDGDRHFCHVFCVLTADVATEIIVTLGQAFEVCYRLANNTFRIDEPITIDPVI